MAQASVEKLEHTGPAEKEKVASCHRQSSWQVRQSPPCQNEKEQSRQFRVPDHEGGESQGGRVREEDQSESMEWKEWTSP